MQLAFHINYGSRSFFYQLPYMHMRMHMLYVHVYVYVCVCVCACERVCIYLYNCIYDVGALVPQWYYVLLLLLLSHEA